MLMMMTIARKMKTKKSIEMRIWISDDIKSELWLDRRSERLSIDRGTARDGWQAEQFL